MICLLDESRVHAKNLHTLKQDIYVFAYGNATRILRFEIILLDV